MEPLFLGTPLSAGTVQMLEYNDICVVMDCHIHDEMVRLYGDVSVDVFSLFPEPGSLPITMLLGFLIRFTA